MKVVRTRAELESALASLDGRVGFVPTMGNLHAGHLKLVQTASAHADAVVASIFVNPLQFGPREDFASYPRTLEADRAALESAGVALLFAPGLEDIYPEGSGSVPGISVPHDLAGDLEGRSRPGHFDGVATVVYRLFSLVRPDVAVFGEKDFQQLLVIRWLVDAYVLPIAIVAEPTVRDPDGLALSSRNQYLDLQERARAPALYRALYDCAEALKRGEDDFMRLEEAAETLLEQAGFIPDYVAIRNAADLSAPEPGAQLVVLGAARLGKARLIDNLRV